MTTFEEYAQVLRERFEEIGDHNDLMDNEGDRKATIALLYTWTRRYLNPYLVPGESWEDLHKRFGLPELQNVISFAYSLGRRGGRGGESHSATS